MSHTNYQCSLNHDIHMIQHIITNRSYGVEYQPIIDIKTGEITAYEALARFRYNDTSISPDKFFGICHKNLELFAKVESTLKRFQFLHAPKDKTLFINFDPHILHNEKWVKHFFKLLAYQKNFVIELVENSYDGINTEKLLEIFKQLNYQFAVDDFFQDNSKVSLFLLKKCHILKFDRYLINELKETPSFEHMVKGLVDFAHANNKQVIFEGVEKEEDLEIVKKMGGDCVQGFLYSKEFIRKFHK